MTRSVLVLLLAPLLAGCGVEPGGGWTSEPTVRLKVDELDDEDVATVSAAEAGSIAGTPVFAPDGSRILPPEQRPPE